MYQNVIPDEPILSTVDSSLEETIYLFLSKDDESKLRSMALNENSTNKYEFLRYLIRREYYNKYYK